MLVHIFLLSSIRNLLEMKRQETETRVKSNQDLLYVFLAASC